MRYIAWSYRSYSDDPIPAHTSGGSDLWDVLEAVSEKKERHHDRLTVIDTFDGARIDMAWVVQ